MEIHENIKIWMHILLYTVERALFSNLIIRTWRERITLVWMHLKCMYSFHSTCSNIWLLIWKQELRMLYTSSDTTVCYMTKLLSDEMNKQKMELNTCLIAFSNCHTRYRFNIQIIYDFFFPIIIWVLGLCCTHCK